VKGARQRRSGRDHDGFLLGGCSEAAHSSRPSVDVAMSRSATKEEEELSCEVCRFLSRHVFGWAASSDVCCVAGKRRASHQVVVGQLACGSLVG
jgi:hypothetical protein